MDFNEKDVTQLKQRGLTPEDVEYQISRFKTGFTFARLVAPATANKGICVFSDKEADFYSEFFDKNHGGCHISKFVPASGAATRMFKDIFEFRNKTDDRLLSDAAKDSATKFFEGLKSFAFYNDISEILAKKNININDCLQNKNYNVIIDNLLNSEGLNYGSLPKGLLKFHSYSDRTRTAAEEHIVEAAKYAVNMNSSANIHFTVSSEHLSHFKMHVGNVKDFYSKFYNINFNISFSVQKPSTDTIAVDLDNIPFREKDGSLHFRPGGHGALIENLNDLAGDIIFIKNIDNIVHERLAATTVKYKKVIAGYLIYIVKQSFLYLDKLSSGELTDNDYQTIADFAEKKMSVIIPKGFNTWPLTARHEFLFRRLNHPVRVCGMVKNTGEPGGGPFWVKDKRGEASLQIVESSQIDMLDSEQNAIFKSATHFNPVDIVCSVRDYKGDQFNLKKYIDEDSGFISNKSKDGKPLKAMELPGLWNGAMAYWNTVFVEVPIATFNPVKTINDLLRPEHGYIDIM